MQSTNNKHFKVLVLINNDKRATSRADIKVRRYCVLDASQHVKKAVDLEGH